MAIKLILKSLDNQPLSFAPREQPLPQFYYRLCIEMHSLQLLTLPRNASSEQLDNHTLQEQENAKALCSVTTTLLFFSTGFQFVPWLLELPASASSAGLTLKKKKGGGVMSASFEFT